MLRLIFGDDIFISYSRRDGGNYAAALANELSKPSRNFSCFLDQWGASAANELSKPVVKALRRSSVLVLVGTPGSVQSHFVPQELEIFSRRTLFRAHRPILPINISGALSSVEWKQLTGLHRMPETGEASAEGVPSEAVIRLITNSYSYTKRNQRVRLLSFGALALLLVSIAVSLLAFQQRALAQAKAIEATENAQKAQEQQNLAIKNKEQADKSATEAVNSARTAKEQEKKALENEKQAIENATRAREAEEAKLAQISMAQSRALADDALRAIPFKRQEAADKSAKALRASNTPQAADAVRQVTILRGAIDASFDISQVKALGFAHHNGVVALGTNPSPTQRRDNAFVFIRCANRGSDQDMQYHAAYALSGPNGEQLNALASSPSSWIIAAGKREIYAWNIDSPAVEQCGDLNILERPQNKPLIFSNADDITALAISDSGTLMASGDIAGTTVVRELPSGRVINTIVYAAEWPVYSKDSSGKLVSQAADKNQKGVTALAFSHDEKNIAVATGAGAVLIWPSAQKILKPWRIDTLITPHTVAFHPNGKIVAIGNDNGIFVSAAGAQAGPVQENLKGHTRPVNSVVFSSDGKFLVSGSDDQTVRVWNMEGIEDPNRAANHPRGGDRLLMTLVGHSSSVNGVAVSELGNMFASGGQDGVIVIRTFDMLVDFSQSQYHDRRPSHEGANKGHRRSSPKYKVPEEQVYIGVGELDKARAGKLQAILGTHLIESVHSEQPDGSFRYLNTMQISRPKAEQILQELNRAGIPAEIIQNGMSGNTGPTLPQNLTNKQTSALNSSLLATTIKMFTETDYADSVAFSPNSHRFVYSARGIVKVFNVDSWALLKTLLADNDKNLPEVNALKFSPDGHWLAAGTRSGEIILYKTTDWSVGKLFNHPGKIKSITFSPDSKLLASGGDDQKVMLWDIEHLNFVRTIGDAPGFIEGLAFSHDGKRLAAGGFDGTIKIWDIATETPPMFIPTKTEGGVGDIMFNSDDSWLASGSNDGRILLWNPSTGALLRTLRWYPADRLADGRHVFEQHFSLSSDGRQLVSGENNNLAFWDAMTGAFLGILQGHTQSIRGTAISPDGRLLASASQDYTVRVWRLNRRKKLTSKN